MKTIPLALMASVLILLLRQYSGTTAILLTVACCVAISALGLAVLDPLLDFLVRLRILGNLDEASTKILIKAVGLSILVEFACGICEDAGQASVGKMVRLCGNGTLLLLSLPLLESVLDLLEKLLGG